MYAVFRLGTTSIVFTPPLASSRNDSVAASYVMAPGLGPTNELALTTYAVGTLFSSSHATIASVPVPVTRLQIAGDGGQAPRGEADVHGVVAAARIDQRVDRRAVDVDRGPHRGLCEQLDALHGAVRHATEETANQRAAGDRPRVGPRIELVVDPQQVHVAAAIGRDGVGKDGVDRRRRTAAGRSCRCRLPPLTKTPVSAPPIDERSSEIRSAPASPLIVIVCSASATVRAPTLCVITSLPPKPLTTNAVLLRSSIDSAAPPKFTSYVSFASGPSTMLITFAPIASLTVNEAAGTRSITGSRPVNVIDDRAAVVRQAPGLAGRSVPGAGVYMPVIATPGSPVWTRRVAGARVRLRTRSAP